MIFDKVQVNFRIRIHNPEFRIRILQKVSDPDQQHCKQKRTRRSHNRDPVQVPGTIFLRVRLRFVSLPVLNMKHAESATLKPDQEDVRHTVPSSVSDPH
jgi:hypothetical protein